MSLAAIETAGDWLLVLDAAGTVLAAKPAVALTVRRRVPELVGQSFFEVLAPADAAAWRSQLDRVVQTREPRRLRGLDEAAGCESLVLPLLDEEGTTAAVVVCSLPGPGGGLTSAAQGPAGRGVVPCAAGVGGVRAPEWGRDMRRAALLNAVHALFDRAAVCQDLRALSRLCCSVARDLSRSDHALLYLLSLNGRARLLGRCGGLAESAPAAPAAGHGHGGRSNASREARRGASGRDLAETPQGLLGRVMKDLQVPAGGIRSLRGSPLRLRWGRTGLLVLVNPPTDLEPLSEAQAQEELERVADAVAQVLRRARARPTRGPDRRAAGGSEDRSPARATPSTAMVVEAGTPALGGIGSAPAPGLIGVVGRYYLTEFIGEGRAGWVYRGHSPDQGLDVAVKLLKPAVTAQGRVVACWLKELRQLEALGHARIMPVLETSVGGAGAFYVTPFMVGGNLEHYAKSQGPFDARTLLRIARQIAEGLAHLHRHGLLHLGLRPGNVLLDASGNLRLNDPGWRLPASPDQELWGGAGEDMPAGVSASHRAGPGGDQGVRADLRAFGAVLEFLLAGAPPAVGDAASGEPERRRKAPPRDVPASNEAVLAALRSVAASARATGTRCYASAADLLRDLDRSAQRAPGRPR